MSYRYVYPNTGGSVGAAPAANGYGIDPSAMGGAYPTANMYNTRRQQSYSPGSFSSDSESSEDYEYRGRMITRDVRRPRDVVRAPTPPPIIKRVVERAPTPEAPVMERVIIRPQAQEIVERVIEQPRTPPPRIIEKEMQEEAPPPIVRTRVIKVDRPLRSGYSQPGSPYGNPCGPGLPSFSTGMMGNNPYRNHSIIGSVGRPATFQQVLQDTNPSFSSASSFEYVPPAPMTPHMAPTNMMMMPTASQQGQPFGVMQQATQPMTMMPNQAGHQQQIMYRPMTMNAGGGLPGMMTPAGAPMQSHYMPAQNYGYPAAHPGMSFGYRPMMQQQARMIPAGMPMMPPGAAPVAGTNQFLNPATMFNPLAQQLVY